LTSLAALWWIFFFTAVGLCLGSFLNAVIYRLPRLNSLRHPRWSFCPSCKHAIHWYDNLPMLSFVLLGGRCRHCGVPISTRYLVIEASMALIVLMLLDAFFIGHVRDGLSDSVFGLTDRLSDDWPIFAAHIVLFGCLLPMSAIDLEHYWIDIRFTNLATIVGFVGHTLWTPRHSMDWTRPSDTTSVVSICALIGLGIVWVWMICRPRAHEDEPAIEEVEETPFPGGGVRASRRPPPSLASPSRAFGWIAGPLLVLMVAALVLDEAFGIDLRQMGRGLLPLAFFFVLIVWESTVRRPADQQIVEAIHEERHGARRMVLGEFMVLLPALAAGVIGYLLMTGNGELPDRLSQALHGTTRVWSWSPFRNWQPMYGFATAAGGYIIAGALGWGVRILFTLLFGKEAFGSGDIHLMAAAGCVAGWPVVVLGFFLTCALALIGWLAALPFKRSRALPLGPWLSLSFLTVVLFYKPIATSPIVDRAVATIEFLITGHAPRPLFRPQP